MLCLGLAWTLFWLYRTAGGPAVRTPGDEKAARVPRGLERLLDELRAGRRAILPRLAKRLRAIDAPTRDRVLETVLQVVLAEGAGSRLLPLLAAFPREVFPLLARHLERDDPLCPAALELLAVLYVDPAGRSWLDGVTVEGLSKIRFLLTAGLDEADDERGLKLRTAAMGLVASAGDRASIPLLERAARAETTVERRRALEAIVESLRRLPPSTSPGRPGDDGGGRRPEPRPARCGPGRDGR